jgi:signal transduction histidine kinase
MNLVPKLSTAFIAGFSLILAANGYRRVHREVAIFEADRIRDDVQIGKTLSAAVTTVWHTDGQDRALAMVRDADANEGRVRVRWVWLDDDASGPLAVARQDLLALPHGGSVTRVATAGQEPRRFTFVPVSDTGDRQGALEISEPLATEQAYVHRTIVDTVATELTLVGVCAAMAMLLGAWIVGRPMALLVEKARRVGNGDFGGPLQLAQTDEIGGLAQEMNAMCDRLVAANERAATEMRARVEMLEQLRHADRLMTVGKLASGVAHELGTPLNVIEARAAMIGNGETTQEESVGYAKVIVRAAERMTRIIRQLLAFARPRGVQKARCDLSLVAHRAVELLQPLADKRRVALGVRGLAPAYAEVDAGQVEQTITNLMMNAVQASPEGGQVELTIDRTRAKAPADLGAKEMDVLRLRVRDEGHGIAEEHLPRVFEPFFTTKDVGEGTGLGLAVTYGIVHEHGGWIAVASQVGRGTTFSVYLPAPEGATG